MREAHIAGHGTALPHRVSLERFLEVDAEARRRLGQGEGTLSLIRQLAENSGIRFRHSVEPCWLPDYERPADVEDIFTDNEFDPPGWQRALEWQRTAPRLAVAAARAALARWGGSPSDITHVVTTCTSGWSEPGIACELIYSLGLKMTCQKQELNFNGCFAGATCLRLARDIVRAGESGAVLVVAVETPSIQYDCVATEMSDMVATILFGDGASAVVVAPEGPWKFERAGMSLVPGTRQLLRMAPNTTAQRDTYRMYLDRTIGARLGEYFRNEEGRELLDAILSANDGLPTGLAVHPGGPNILEALRSVFEARGWPANPLASSTRTLHDVGNLGAAALMFVLSRTLDVVEDDCVATLAFGPGVTVEWGLLRRV